MVSKSSRLRPRGWGEYLEGRDDARHELINLAGDGVRIYRDQLFQHLQEKPSSSNHISLTMQYMHKQEDKPGNKPKTINKGTKQASIPGDLEVMQAAVGPREC